MQADLLDTLHHPHPLHPRHNRGLGRRVCTGGCLVRPDHRGQEMHQQRGLPIHHGGLLHYDRPHFDLHPDTAGLAAQDFVPEEGLDYMGFRTGSLVSRKAKQVFSDGVDSGMKASDPPPYSE